MSSFTHVEIEIARIVPDPDQPRRTFDAAFLEELTDSVRKRGILQPIRVRPDPEPLRDLFIIVTGETRFLAAKRAGLQTVPCIVDATNASAADILADQLAENVMRANLKAIDLARGIERLKAVSKLSNQDIADRYAISPATISRAMALLNLPSEIQAMVENGQIPDSAAYELSRLRDEDSMLVLAHAVAAGRMTRDAVAEAVRERIGRKARPQNGSRISCRTHKGVGITFTATEGFDWELLAESIDELRKQVRSLMRDGKPVGELPKAFRTG